MEVNVENREGDRQSVQLIGELDEDTAKNFIKAKNYEVIQVIGSGAFGIVFHCLTKTNEERAIKVVYVSDEGKANEYSLEARCSKNFVHENVVKTFDHWIETTRKRAVDGTLNNVKEDFLFIEMELCRQSLCAAIESGVLKNQIVTAWLIIVGLLRGLHYIHKRSLVHRDINPKNIFLTADLQPKIGDFGEATHTFRLFHRNGSKTGSVQQESLSDNSSNASVVTHGVGTPLYSAPEIVNGKYTKEVDVFSLGITITEMFLATSDCKPENREKLLEKIQELSTNEMPAQIRAALLGQVLLEGFSRLGPFATSANALVRAMIEHNPQKRASTAILLTCTDLNSCPNSYNLGLLICLTQRRRDAEIAKNNHDHFEFLRAFRDVADITGTLGTNEAFAACQPLHRLMNNSDFNEVDSSKVQDYSRMSINLIDRALHLTNDKEELMKLLFLRWENDVCAVEVTSLEKRRVIDAKHYLNKLCEFAFPIRDCPPETLRQARIFTTHLTKSSDELDDLNMWLKYAQEFPDTKLSEEFLRLKADVHHLLHIQAGNYAACVFQWQKLLADSKTVFRDDISLQRILMAVDELSKTLPSSLEIDSFASIFEVIGSLQELLRTTNDKQRAAEIYANCLKITNDEMQRLWIEIEVLCFVPRNFTVNVFEPATSLLDYCKRSEVKRCVQNLYRYSRLKIILSDDRLHAESNPQAILLLLEKRWTSDLCLKNLADLFKRNSHNLNISFYLDKLYETFAESYDISSKVYRQARIYAMHLDSIDDQHLYLRKFYRLLLDTGIGEPAKLVRDMKDVELARELKHDERIRFWHKVITKSEGEIEDIEFRRMFKALVDYGNASRSVNNSTLAADLKYILAIFRKLEDFAFAQDCTSSLASLQNAPDSTKLLVEKILQELQDTQRRDEGELVLSGALLLEESILMIQFIQSLMRGQTTENLVKLVDSRWKCALHHDSIVSVTINGKPTLQLANAQTFSRRLQGIVRSRRNYTAATLRLARQYASYICPDEHLDEEMERDTLSKWAEIFAFAKQSDELDEELRKLGYNIRDTGFKKHKDRIRRLNFWWEIISDARVLDDPDFTRSADAVDNFLRAISQQLYTKKIWLENYQKITDILQNLDMGLESNSEKALQVGYLRKRTGLANKLITLLLRAKGSKKANILRILRFSMNFFDFKALKRVENMQLETFNTKFAVNRMIEHVNTSDPMSWLVENSLRVTETTRLLDKRKKVTQNVTQKKICDPYDYELWEELARQCVNNATTRTFADIVLEGFTSNLLEALIDLIICDCSIVLEQPDDELNFTRREERLAGYSLQKPSEKTTQKHALGLKLASSILKLEQHALDNDYDNDNLNTVYFEKKVLKSCTVLRNAHYFIVINRWRKIHPDNSSVKLGEACDLLVRFNWNCYSKEYINYNILHDGDLTLVLQTPDKIPSRHPPMSNQLAQLL